MNDVKNDGSEGCEAMYVNNMFHGNGYEAMVHDNDIIHGAEMNHVNELVVSGEVTRLTTPRRQKKSAIWEHFTLVDVSEGCKRASCNHCNQSLAYCSGSKHSGTSHLTRHIKEWCRALKDQQKSNGAEGDAEQPSKKRYRYTPYANGSYDQDRSCSSLAKMVILNDYPLHIGQQPAFLSFIESMQPRFKMIDIGKIEAEVHAIYHKERDNLQHALETMPGRIGLILGSWTTSQTLGYVSIAGQFIDSEWNLHRRMLNFMMAPLPHSENTVSEAITKGLSGWNIQDRLFTVTLDHDCLSHDIYNANLRDHLSSQNIGMIKGQLYVVRCYAHILNEVAHDVITSVNSIIYNIRESIKFLKAGHTRETKFAEIALQLEIPNTNTLCLDVTTEWNTTYLMLLAALDYRQAFTILETCDENYNVAPSTEDWKKVEAACSYLKLLYESAQNIMSAENPTANIFFHEAWALQLELSNATAHEDLIISTIAKSIHERFDKYWRDCHLVLAIAVVMDPRFKMKLVEFAYSKIYGSEAAKYVKVVHGAVHELYKEYVAPPLPLTPTFTEQGITNDVPAIENSDVPAIENSVPATAVDGLVDFDMYLSVAMSQSLKYELDQYLEEELVQRTPEFNILNWWQHNALKYPTLSRMARDVLAIPMSTASGSSSIFSAGTAGTRTLDEYRSSLRPDIVEALVCAKDWLQFSPMSAPHPLQS